MSSTSSRRRKTIQHLTANTTDFFNSLLVMNAIEAMHSAQSRLLRIQTQQNGLKMVLVSVVDSGAGIDPSNAARVFEHLFTTKSHGMGMGLAICRSIIENHNGRIWASPGINRGSIFQFELPIKSNNASVGSMAA